MERTLLFGSFLDSSLAEEWMELMAIMGPEVDCDLGSLLTNLCTVGFEQLYLICFQPEQMALCHFGSLMNTYTTASALLC